MNVYTLDHKTIALPLSFITSSPVLEMLFSNQINSSIDLPVLSNILMKTLEYASISHSLSTTTTTKVVDEAKPKNETIEHYITHFQELVFPWEYDFVETLTDTDLQDVFVFADYIDLQSLRMLLGKKIAFEIKQCKTVKHLRDRFGVHDDFTAQELKILVEESNCLHSKVLLE